MKISAPVIVLVSELDEAGQNMLTGIKEEVDFLPAQLIDRKEDWPEGKYSFQLASDESFGVLQIPHSQIFTDYLEGVLDCKLVIFASKHSSAAGKKAILAHPLGNWGEPFEGSGQPSSIGIVLASALFRAYHALKKRKAEARLANYWLGLEVSHHGPTELDVPAIFMETGGTLEEWQDLKATKVVAQAILDVIQSIDYPEEEIPAAIGIGGGHYAPSYIKRVDARMFRIGHMTPKFHSEKLDESMLTNAWEKTRASEKIFLLDKKGLKGSERRRIIDLLDKLEFPYALTTDFPTS